MFIGQAAVAASVHPGIMVAQVSQQQPQQITMPTPVQGVRPIGNTVRVRASTSAGAAATPTAGGGQQIKVVQGAQPDIKVAQANLRQTAVIGGQVN